MVNEDPKQVNEILQKNAADERAAIKSAEQLRADSRIKQLEGLVHDNPSAGNYEELGDLYMEDGKIAQARAAMAESASEAPAP